MPEPILRSVDVKLTTPPYPDDVRAGNYRMPLDVARMQQSDTWMLAAAELRPWLLMLWVAAWSRIPMATLPEDDEMIASIIGMSPTLFAAHRKTLLRGWQKHDDGRLYHAHLTTLVLEMLRTRRHLTERQQRWKSKKAAEEFEKKSVTRYSRVNNASDVDVDVKTRSKPSELSTGFDNALSVVPTKIVGKSKAETDRKPLPGESAEAFVARMAKEIAARKLAKP